MATARGGGLALKGQLLVRKQAGHIGAEAGTAGLGHAARGLGGHEILDIRDWGWLGYRELVALGHKRRFLWLVVDVRLDRRQPALAESVCDRAVTA